MPNPLTGDYQAVAQVSGRTLNRLLASMHQNAGANPNVPSVLHQAVFRIGDFGFHDVIAGVRGTAWIQLGPPSVELIHGARDRFTIETWVRAYYEPDPGTATFPSFIYGRVRADYRVAVIEYAEERQGTQLWVGVDRRSVTFTSATPDTSHDAQITEQVRSVLTRRLPVTPHKLLEDFKKRRFRSLVGAGESAVVHPLNVIGAGATGTISSVNQVFLGGRDFAVAVDRDLVLDMFKPALDAIKTANPVFSLKLQVWKPWPLVEDFPGAWRTVAEPTWQVTFDSATATWQAGKIVVDVTGKAITTYDLAPNASFSAHQTLQLAFDPGTETLTLDPIGAPAVSASVTGAWDLLIKGAVESAATSLFSSQLNAALAAAKPGLQAALGQKAKLVKQFQSMDSGADARFTSAEFLAEGFVLRGSVTVTPRQNLSVTTKRLGDRSGYTAYSSWAPGGRITRFDWFWYWKTDPLPLGTPPDGSETHEDRFLLRTSQRLPGITYFPPNGGPPEIPAGRVCLSVKALQVDQTTGEEREVDNSGWAERSCIYVVHQTPDYGGIGIAIRPKRKWWVAWMVRESSSGARVAAYVEAGGTPAKPFNTLVHFLDEPGSIDSLRPLAEGLRAARRRDAGVLVTLVLREGLLERGGADLLHTLAGAVEGFQSPLVITEDAEGGWSGALEVPPEHRGPATRLIDPKGDVAWRYDRATDATTVAAALREHLQPSALPKPEPIELRVTWGDSISELGFVARSGWVTLDQLRGSRVSVTFVQPWMAPCIAQLHRLQRLQERWQRLGVVVVAIVDGVSVEETAELARQHGFTFLLSADPNRTASGRLGVRAWPTTIGIDENGHIVAIEMGVDGGALAAMSRG